MASLRVPEIKNKLHPVVFIAFLLAGIPAGILLGRLIYEDAFRLYSVVELARLYLP